MGDLKNAKKVYKQKPPDMGIYQIKNLASGKIYIGRAMDLNGKLNSEKFQLKHDMHMNRGLQDDFNASSPDGFSFAILDRLLPKDRPAYDYDGDLKELEAMWLEKLQPYDARGYHKRKP
jgi:hypothetical protein